MYFLLLSMAAAAGVIEPHFAKDFVYFPQEKNLVKNDGKVHVDIYYESLCEGCRIKMKNSYLPAINTPGFFDMADIRVYPFGNTNEWYNETTGLYDYECQHGNKECKWNTLQVCALHF